MQLKLVYYPDPRLLNVCKEAHSQSMKDRANIIAGMWAIMKNNGVGLAANQVGLNMRMFIWNEQGNPQGIWNPILSCVSGSAFEKEGCLSIPKVNVTMERGTSSVLNGEGMNGLPLQFIGGLLLTRIWQHEIDHLDGKLIIDNMNNNETIANKKVLKRLLKNAVT